MIQGKDYLKNKDIYSSLITPAKTPEIKTEEPIKTNKSKVHDLFKQPEIKSSETIPNTDSKIAFYISEETEKAVESEKALSNPVNNVKKVKTDTAYKAIEKTQKAISIVNTIADITAESGYSDLLKSSRGVLDATKGIIQLDNAKSSKNTTKEVMNSISDVANGVGTVLDVVDIPEAQFLTFTGKVLKIGVEQQDLTDNIEKKDARGIVGNSVSIVKGAWGTVVSGLEAGKLAASLGQKAGFVEAATVVKVSNTATKISKVADKVAIPFSVAGTALNVWDLKNAHDKVEAKKVEIETAKTEEAELPKNSKDYKTKEAEIKKLEKELDTLETNMTFRGVSSGLSAISTTALIVSVAYPPMAKVSNVVALVGNITSGVAGTLSNDEKRVSALKAYETVKDKYDGFLAKIDKFVFCLKPEKASKTA